MNRFALPFLLLTVGLGAACGARSTLAENESGASSAGGASSSTAVASSSTGGTLPQKVWSRKIEGTLAPHPLTIDGEGHIWLLGGKILLNDNYPTQWGSTHLWKLSAQGDVEIDATYMGGQGFQVVPRAIHADATGGVLLAGQALRQPGAATTLDIGGKAIPFPFAASAFLVKLDAGGKYVWSQVYNGGDGGDGFEPYSSLQFVNMGADADGRWHLYANVNGAKVVDLGAGPITNFGQILLTLSPEGDYLSSVLVAEDFWTSWNFIVEPSGHSWLAGGTEKCNEGLRVQRFDPAGAVVADACPPSTCWVEDVDLALDGKGGVFVTELADPGDHCDDQLFLRRMDASGNVTWALHGQPYIASTTVATTPAGHAVLGSSFSGSLDLGSGPLATTGEEDTQVFLGDIDSEGTVSSATQYGAEGNQLIMATAVDAQGARVIVGQFDGVVDFGDGPLEGGYAGTGDKIFVARFPP